LKNQSIIGEDVYKSKVPRFYGQQCMCAQWNVIMTSEIVWNELDQRVIFLLTKQSSRGRPVKKLASNIEG